MKRSTSRSIVSLVLAVIIFIIAGFILLNTLNAKANDETVFLFGYSFHVVVTDSMTGEIEVGDFVLAKKCTIDEVVVGDNIVFEATSGVLMGQKVIHKAKEITYVKGEVYIATQGVKPGAPVDENPVTAANIIGKEVLHSATIGSIVTFLSNVTNWLFLAILWVLLMVIIKVVKLIISSIRGDDKEPIDEEEDDED